MAFVGKVFVICQLTGLIISLGIFVYAWSRRDTFLGRTAAGMMLSLIIWLSSNLIPWFSDDPIVHFFWMKVGYLGVYTLPVGWFVYALTLSGHDRWINRRVVGLLFILPVFLIYLVFSGPFFKEVIYSVQNGSPHVEIVFSDWVILAAGYFYLLIGAGTFLMVRSAMRATPLMRFRTAMMIAASVFPLISNIAYLTKISPIPFDITSLTFVITGSILVMGTMRYRLFDPVPIGRGAVVDLVNESVIVIDDLARMVDLNLTAQKILSVNPRALYGRPLADLLPDLIGLPPQAEIDLPTKSGLLNFEAQVTPLLSDDQVLVGHLIILHDITNRKQVETGLQVALERQREINEMKSRFYSYFTHQLRTPLSVVLSSSELLEHYGRNWPEEKRHMHFQRIYQAIDHLLELSERATLYDRSERHLQVPPKAEAFNPVEAVSQLVEEMNVSDQRRHPVLFDSQGEAVQAHQDLTLLRAVLENVIGNALKFSPEGKPVYVDVDIAPPLLKFSVRDEGCGIPADELARVYQPFFRASNVSSTPGTGLGLAIVSHYLTQLGGELHIDSVVNVGTVVTFTLPLELPS